jgi:uncharacterized protein YaeQ
VALTATVYHLEIQLSDVDRNVYEALDLRLARHPSETMRYLLTRAIAYALEYEEGIAFSRGLSTVEEPAVWVRDLQGTTKVWIDIGAPSAERLHKARKAVDRVVVYTHQDIGTVRRNAATRAVHKADTIEVNTLAPGFLDALEAATDRHARWELVRTGGSLYVTIDGKVIEGAVEKHSLADG